GRAFEDIVAAIGRRDRLDIVAALRGEIVERVEAAALVEALDDVGRDRPLIKAFPSLARDALQTLGERRHLEPVAEAREAAVPAEDGGAAGIAQRLREAEAEIEGDARRDQHALLGELDGRRQQLRHLPGAVILEEREPGIDRARHRRRMRALDRDLREAMLD